MVVGIRVTNSANRNTTGIAVPDHDANTGRVPTTNRKIRVMPTRRMVSAISLGVFCRFAPSTSEIIRSRKLSPGSTLIRTTMRSDTTRVPPVTAERSPPDSRITAADSPVIALSSTVAMPAMTSPSPGITSPASQTTRSPARKSAAATVSNAVSAIAATRFARVSVLVRRRLAAWALPRPSAIASAKLAKRTVNHSHALICTIAPKWSPPRAVRPLAASATSAVTNITGLRTSSRGSSLRTAPMAASRRAARSSSAMSRGR